MMALALPRRERFLIFFLCDLSNYNQLLSPPPTLAVTLPQNVVLPRKNCCFFLHNLLYYILVLGTSDFDAQMSDIKFCKGNENIRPDYKNRFTTDWMAACIVHRKYTLPLLWDNNFLPKRSDPDQVQLFRIRPNLSDPDLQHWWYPLSVLWIRIRTGIHFGRLDPDPGGPNRPTKVKTIQVLKS
jgi:hypothetical protein